MEDFIIEDDLLISGGDFAIEHADQQNLVHILLSQKGSYKEFPVLGVGISSYINSGQHQIISIVGNIKLRQYCSIAS